MKKLGIWAIAIAGTFLIGIFSANPVVEAVGGWQLALEEHFADGSAHHTQYTDAQAVSAVESGTLSSVTTSGEYF